MSLTESIVDDAALTWFGELGYTVGNGLRFAADELTSECFVLESPEFSGGGVVGFR